MGICVKITGIHISYHTIFPCPVKYQTASLRTFPHGKAKENSSRQSSCCFWEFSLCRYLLPLLLAEGLAVGTLIHRRIHLVGTYQNPVQCTVVGISAVMCALLHGTLDALICMTIHVHFLLFRMIYLLWTLLRISYGYSPVFSPLVLTYFSRLSLTYFCLSDIIVAENLSFSKVVKK